MKERVCGKEHTLKITDAYTLESDILTIIPVGSCDVGEHWGQRSYSVIGGVCVNSFRLPRSDRISCSAEN